MNDNESPHAIAPDGQVIYLAPIPNYRSTCRHCYMYEDCKKENDSIEDIAKVLGVKCTEIDTPDIEHAWRAVDYE